MNKRDIAKQLEERILVLDGGMGTMIQRFNLTEKEYRGEQFADWDVELKGCNDLLTLTKPEVIEQIHLEYLEAGADIILTDSFNSTAVSLADYGLERYAYEISFAAAEVARRAVERFQKRNPEPERWVAGSMGPTSETTSISPDVNDPSQRGITFDQLAEAYGEQARGLLDGGVDALIIETIFDTLNAKTAIYAIKEEFKRRGSEVPIMISVTVADSAGRNLSGQTVEAFYTSLRHAEPLSIGLNCGFGAKQLQTHLERLSAISDCHISAHPNAGLPNVMGDYDETAEVMATYIEGYLKEGLVNIIGGCCGTTPSHIAAIAELVKRYRPRKLPAKRHISMLSGLEPLTISAESNFINVGERTNVAGSARFARLIRERKFDEALSVAREQVEAGAQIVDVCMDDGLIDGVEAMGHFLNLAMSEPEIARVPMMIDSSVWDVLVAGLKCVQGKSIVNSISLKEGEEQFVKRAKTIKQYGAAAVVMLFDEEGQAESYARKIEVAQRAYDVLTKRADFPAEDIVFDPNILAVATGIAEHDNYGVDFISAVKWIKDNLPYSKVSGGVSNLSFAFRGNNSVREAMHSVFLYHAIEAGMDMGIVNPAMLQIYSEIEPQLLTLAEDVVLNRRPDAAERLMEYAEKVKSDGATPKQGEAKVKEWREGSLRERINHAMMRGVTDHIEEDIVEAYNHVGSALGVIDNMLMPAMERVGELFGKGEMFLPQVVKSARVMKRSVDVLEPYITEGAESDSSPAGKILVATVKGDVHDIGKNIVSVVMSCNGYSIDDLGVMVDSALIADRAEEWGADVVGLSGLITPSLGEMINVVKEFERRGLSTPIIIGGATTSKLHTALKIAPEYSGVVVHSHDASENVGILNRLLGEERENFIIQVRAEQQQLRETYERRNRPQRLISIEEARQNRYVKPEASIIKPTKEGRVVIDDLSIEKVREFIDWTYFFHAWEIKGGYPDVLNSPDNGGEARKLYSDANAMLDRIVDERLLKLQGVVGIFPAHSEGDDIVIEGEKGGVRLAQLRNQESKEGVEDRGNPLAKYNLSLADFVATKELGQDYIGAFILTAGVGLKVVMDRFKREGDDYSAIMVKLLADRLTEAFAELVHLKVRRETWGYENGEEPNVKDILKGNYQGVRVAFGYPSAPDHSLKNELFELLDIPNDMDITITDNHMIAPGESLCGLMFAQPESHYFSVGKIDQEQLHDYAERRGRESGEIERLIAQHIFEE